VARGAAEKRRGSSEEASLRKKKKPTQQALACNNLKIKKHKNRKLEKLSKKPLPKPQNRVENMRLKTLPQVRIEMHQ
jgi:hypothetical protein